MSKKNVFKVAGFIGTLGAGAALVATAATGTGAWFTSSKDGSFTATSGHLKLNAGNTTLSFADLMPGENKTQVVNFNVDTSGKTDVWLTLDKTDAGVDHFTGHVNGLGRYGHFEVWNGSTRLFRSTNLADGPESESCVVNSVGQGGSDEVPSGPDDTTPYCGVPAAIKIADNLSDGAAGQLRLVFGLTGKASGFQDTTWASVPFKLVATQHGHAPGDANF